MVECSQSNVHKRIVNDDENDVDSDINAENTSLQRALMDIELMIAAYPDEVSRHVDDSAVNETDSRSSDAKEIDVTLPQHLLLRLSQTAHCVIEIPNGYPDKAALHVISYRSSPSEKAGMEKVLQAIHNTALSCQADEMEAGLMCCSAALEAWQEQNDLTRILATINNTSTASSQCQDNSISPLLVQENISIQEPFNFQWISSPQPLIDRKSTFIAHACRIKSEKDVHVALSQLISNSSKLQRATHNMYAYRLTESISNGNSSSAPTFTTILKHDNDDDGETGAGSKLAHLLQVRNEDGVLVVVSRWFGGIQLGPKRFAHISNVARDILDFCHEHHWT